MVAYRNAQSSQSQSYILLHIVHFEVNDSRIINDLEMSKQDTASKLYYKLGKKSMFWIHKYISLCWSSEKILTIKICLSVCAWCCYQYHVYEWVCITRICTDNYSFIELVVLDYYSTTMLISVYIIKIGRAHVCTPVTTTF